MASIPTSPKGCSGIKGSFMNNFEEIIAPGGSQASGDMPTTQEIYNHFQFLKRKWPFIEDVLSSPFAPKHYRTGKRTIVNKASYISSEAEKVEHRVRLLETEEDIHYSRTAILRCLPSCDPNRCMWVLIRPTRTFVFVKFKIDKPAGYREFNESTGRLEYEKIVARAIVRYGRRNSDVDAEDCSSDDSSEDENSASYSYDARRSPTMTATGERQSNQASVKIPAGERLTGWMSDDCESSSESQNVAKTSKMTDLPDRSTRNEEMIQSPKINRQLEASSIQKDWPHQTTILRMPQAPMYRSTASAGSKSNHFSVGPINRSNDTVQTASSDDSNRVKRKASAADDHGDTSGSSMDVVQTKKMKSPDRPSFSGPSGSKENFVDLSLDEGVHSQEDQKSVVIPGGKRSLNETLGTNSPSDSSKSFPPSFRSSGTPNGSFSPNPADAITTNVTLHDPAVFELLLSYGPPLPGAEPETETHMWRERSIQKLSKAGLFQKVGYRLPRKIALESLTLSLKLKEERKRPSHVVLVEATDEGDENFSLFQEKWAQFIQAGLLRNNTVRVTPRQRGPEA